MSDQSRKGLQIIETIRNVADELVMYDKIGLIVNRAPLPEKITEKEIGSVPVVAVIRPDDVMTENDIEGKSVFELPADSLILEGARTALKNMGVIDEY